MSTSRAFCAPEDRHLAERYSRLAASRTLGGDALGGDALGGDALGGGALQRWCGASIAVVGSGNIGPRFAVEAVRSGAEVWICDPEDAEEVNLGTQDVHAGRPKVEAVIERAEAIDPGRLRGEAIDVRHVGVGFLRRFDLLVDTTDDPALTWALTMISNGLRIPLLRLAIDGSGERELGRVATSHGGGGHACAVCSWSRDDLGRDATRTPCPGGKGHGPGGKGHGPSGKGHGPGGARPPTLAGSAIGLSIAGIGLLQAQRLIGGNARSSALDRELILDLDGHGLAPLELSRSPRCASEHQRWELIELEHDATEATPGGLLERATLDLGTARIELEPWLHPLALETWCSCGARQRAVGSPWAIAPSCEACGGQTRWSPAPTWPRFNAAQAELLGVTGTPWATLGLPGRGAMVTAHAEGHSPRRYLLP